MIARHFDPKEVELMDLPQPVTPELERDLDNLRQLNRYFGSYSLIRRFATRWIKAGDELRILDVATASGDIPRLIVDHARSVNARVKLDALERNAATIDIARNLSGSYPEIIFHEADLHEFEAGEPYDIVFCTLVLHHFSEEEAVRVLAKCRQWSGDRVLVSDLRRGWLATLGVRFLTAVIFRDPMTKFDARLSAARAFSISEMRQLAERAGWKRFHQRGFPFARQAIWIG